MGKISKDRRDIYYRKAKEENYRARSAYKLTQLHQEFCIFNPDVLRVVDLCSAPGSWSQVVTAHLFPDGPDENNSKCAVAVDLQEMAPIPGVHFIQGDITAPETAVHVLTKFGGTAADLMLCDGAPDVTGMHDLDDFMQGQLLVSALGIADEILKPGGSLVAKVFRGEGTPVLIARLLCLFDSVHVCKPASSRYSSREAFAVCRGFRGVSEGNRQHAPFVACGDLRGYDADRNYPASAVALGPVQPPLTAPYIKRASLDTRSPSTEEEPSA
eukprot:Polyplicarium_translucidae@DN3069_c0_g2_i1.p1